MQKRCIDSYVENLILAYFREYNTDYNLIELKDRIGLSFKVLDQYIDYMVDKNELKYFNNLLSLTLKGRINLSKSPLEYYSYNPDAQDCHEFKNVVYYAKNFHKKLGL